MKQLTLLLLSILVANSASFASAMWTEYKAPHLKLNKPLVHKINDKDVVEPLHPKKLKGQNEDDVKCLAYSIFREAGNQTESAQYAVGQVHINRVKEGTWGNHLCEVVFAKKQFSWTEERKQIHWTRDDQEWYMDMAQELIKGTVRVNYITSNKVLHYYANYVNPRWAKQGVTVATAGAHIFVKNVPH
jgi:spore germination cell wall hydrolase CwlJ-like protein